MFGSGSERGRGEGGWFDSLLVGHEAATLIVKILIKMAACTK